MKNLVGAIMIMKDMNVKPNYSELERIYGVDRHLIKEIYVTGKKPEKKKIIRASKWDPFYEEITELFNQPGTTKMSTFLFLQNNHDEALPGNYNSFKSYTLRKNIAPTKTDKKAHVLYETEAGEVLQVDFKEDLKFELSNGEIIEFNVFSATLGFSREHVFIFTQFITTEDFIRCTIETFKKLGGVTASVLTDNASAVKDHKTNKVLPKISAFFNDLGVEFKTCKVRTPETKGIVENSNKFINWIAPYQKKLNTVEELVDLIENVITHDANNQINTGTKLPPRVLFKKEKEYLNPLPKDTVLRSYISERVREKVDNTLLVYYKGARYSVPPEYNGKAVDIYPQGNDLRIYYNSKLIAIHTISQKDVNYNPDHYRAALAQNMPNASEDVIEQFSRSQLEQLDSIRAMHNQIRKEMENKNGK